MHPLHDYAADLATALRIRIYMLRSGWVTGPDAERAQRHAALLARRLRITHSAGTHMMPAGARRALFASTVRESVPGRRAQNAARQP